MPPEASEGAIVGEVPGHVAEAPWPFPSPWGGTSPNPLPGHVAEPLARAVAEAPWAPSSSAADQLEYFADYGHQWMSSLLSTLNFTGEGV